MKSIILIIILTSLALNLFAKNIIYSPQNYEVFQRENKSYGHILVSGKSDCEKISIKITGKDFKNKSYGHILVSGKSDCEKISVIITGKDFKNNKVKIEKKFNNNKYGFSQDIKTPSGGWYRVEIKFNEEVNIIENVGIGEIIIGAGQSNSTNAGQFPTKQTSGYVSNTDGKTWRLANDPQIGNHNYDDGGSLYPSLGDALYKEFNVPIGVAPTGHGATTIEQWQPNHKPIKWSREARQCVDVEEGINLYNYTMDRIYKFGKNGFRCVLWHQGEADYGKTEDYYFEKLSNIIMQSRIDSGWNIPWFVAKASYCPNNPLWEDVRKAQDKIWQLGIAYEGPDTDQWLEEYRDNDGKGVHFAPKGLKIHGEAWAKFIGDYIHSQID